MTTTPSTATGRPPAPASPNGAAPALSALPAAAAAAPRRSPALLLASLALIAVCALAGWWALSTATARTSVLALARTVPYGQAITAADLTTARIGADAALSPIPAADANQVIGRPAATTLHAGSLLVRADLAASPVVPAGSTAVWVPIPSNRISSGALSPQQHVVLVYAPSSAALAATAAGGGSAGPTTIEGSVLSVAPATSDGTIVIAVIVSSDRAALLATWANTASVELTALGGGS